MKTSNMKLNSGDIKTWWFAFYTMLECSFQNSWQRKAVWLGTLFFALSILILFPFALGTQASAREDLRLGIYWATAEFVIALLSLRMFAAETEQGMFDWWLASPTPKSAILLGKAAFMSLEQFSLQLVMLFFWMIFYNFPPSGLQHLLQIMLPVMFLFAVGTACLGTLLQGVVSKTQVKEILFPILFYPLQVSLLLAATTLVLRHEGVYKLAGGWQTGAWWSILIFFPLLMLSLCGILAKTLLEDTH
jgi:heme exporter protein B